MTPKQLTDAIGRRHLAKLLGVTDAAVNNAVSRGPLPPAWFRLIEREAGKVGVECPDHCFGFRLPHSEGSE